MRAKEVNRRIERLGGVMTRQVGSHRRYAVSYTAPGSELATVVTTVAQHPGDIPTGTLRAIERDLEPAFGKGMADAMNAPTDNTYRVIVTREGSTWLADVPELPAAHTFARTLPALDRAVREVVVLAADLPDEAMPSLALEYDYHTGNTDLDAETAQVRALRRQAEHLAEEASASTAAAARHLVTNGVSVRDAATLLGVSPQRISQLTGQSRAS